MWNSLGNKKPVSSKDHYNNLMGGLNSKAALYFLGYACVFAVIFNVYDVKYKYLGYPFQMVYVKLIQGHTCV